MRVSTVILPIYPWREGRDVWRSADDLGFHAAYTYDHLSWRSFRDGPWFGAVPTLAAAAGVTERVRLGTLVSSPNFREPVTFAKDVMTLDDLSGGRVTVGLGAGTTGFDATVLGGEPWSAGSAPTGCGTSRSCWTACSPSPPSPTRRGTTGRTRRGPSRAPSSRRGSPSRSPRPARAGCGWPRATARRG